MRTGSPACSKRNLYANLRCFLLRTRQPVLRTLDGKSVNDEVRFPNMRSFTKVASNPLPIFSLLQRAINWGDGGSPETYLVARICSIVEEIRRSLSK